MPRRLKYSHFLWTPLDYTTFSETPQLHYGSIFNEVHTAELQINSDEAIPSDSVWGKLYFFLGFKKKLLLFPEK